jgi:hypothetical protein
MYMDKRENSFKSDKLSSFDIKNEELTDYTTESNTSRYDLTKINYCREMFNMYCSCRFVKDFNEKINCSFYENEILKCNKE